MYSCTAIVERCLDTGCFVGHVPGFPGAHSQGETLDELGRNLREVVAMLLEDGEPGIVAEYVGTLSVVVPAERSPRRHPDRPPHPRHPDRAQRVEGPRTDPDNTKPEFGDEVPPLRPEQGLRSE